MEAGVGKLDIAKLVNVSTILNNLKTKVDDLGNRKLKTVPVDTKKLNDVVNKKVVKNIKFSTLKTKVNIQVKKIPHVTTLVQIQNI